MSLYSLVAASQSSRKPSRKASRGAEAHSEVHQLTQFHQRVIAEAKQKLATRNASLHSGIVLYADCAFCRWTSTAFNSIIVAIAIAGGLTRLN